MGQEKIEFINKLFDNDDIRFVWVNEKQKYFVSVVDLIGVMTDSKDKQAYWRKLKQRLKEEGNQTVTNCDQLKLKAEDGKYRMTDVVDIEGMFRIIQSIPSKKAEPTKQWLAKLGSERVAEIFNPALAAQRGIELFREQGYDEQWIYNKIRTIQGLK